MINILVQRKDDAELYRKIVLLNVVCTIGITVLIPMGFLAFWQSSYYLGCFDYLIALLLLLTLIYLRRTGKTETASYIGITSVSMFFWFLVFTGGVNNSAYVWIYTFPLFAMFLMGSKKGLMANILFFVPIVLFFAIEPLSSIFTTYSADLKMRIIPSFLVVLAYAYLFEFIRERSYHKLHSEVKKHRKTAKKLHVAKTVSEKANQAKSDFLSNMSHELRTPLNHIIGFTELVVDQHFGELNDTQEEYLKDVLSSSRHLLSLVNDILDLSKVEAGKMELQASELDLESLLKNSLLMFKEKALMHDLEISTQFDDLPECIHADERKIKQVVYNLLSNAVKFTPDGGKITLLAGIMNGNANFLSRIINTKQLTAQGTETPREWLKISVTDTGIGINPAYLQRIFKPFEQVERLESRRYKGTGLGLSLVSKIVELHGGYAWADSKGENKGTTMSFIIPVQASKEINTKDLIN